MRVEGRTRDPDETRYGCFLPDLTGLASGPSAADLPSKEDPELSDFVSVVARNKGSKTKFKTNLEEYSA